MTRFRTLKFDLCAVLVAFGLSAAGCASNGVLNASASSAVTTAYNAVCPSVAALAALPKNAGQTSAYNAAVTICASPAPTNVIVAGLDIIAVDAALAPLLSKVKIKV